MTRKMTIMIWLGFIGLGVGCVPPATPPDSEPSQETAVTITVVDPGGDPASDVELLYREDDGGFVVTHVVGEAIPTPSPRIVTWQVANCQEVGPKDSCSTFSARLACEKTYFIEARHPIFEYEMAIVTTRLINGRCQADPSTVTMQVYVPVKVCTAVAISAVSLTVVDENGDKLISARAAFRIDDGEWQVAQASDICSDGAICGGNFVAGWDEAGHYEIQVEADGYLPTTRIVDVAMEADGCHVKSEQITIPLKPGEGPDAEAIPMCPDWIVPSMYIEVLGEDQLPLPGATVTYQIDGGEWLSPSCVNTERCSIFQAGTDQPGSFIIRAEKEGYQTGLAVSTVPLHPNGCHVVTQRPQITLVPEE